MFRIYRCHPVQHLEGHGGYNMFINLEQGKGEEFFRPPEVEDGEEEEPPDVLG